jgi:hypothetical protein
LAIGLAATIPILIISWLVSGDATQIHILNGQALRLSDFSYHCIIFRSFFDGYISSPYSATEQLSAITLASKIRPSTIMPIGITPSGLALWYPIANYSRSSPNLAYTLWVTGSFFPCALWITLLWKDISIGSKKKTLVLFVAATVLSLAMFRTISLGQTSLLALGALGLILREAQRSSASRPRLWVLAPLILALSLKLTYFTLAIGILVSFKHFRRAIEAVSFIAVISLLVSALGGATLLIDWQDQIGIYTSQAIPTIYQSSLNIGTTNTLRSWFQIFANPSLSFTLSHYSLLALLAIIGTLSISRPKFLKTSESLLALSWYSAVMLFLPYLGAYEEIILLAPVAFVIQSKTTTFNRTEIYLLLITLIVCLNTATSSLLVVCLIKWPAKLLFFAILFGKYVSQATFLNFSKRNQSSN